MKELNTETVKRIREQLPHGSFRAIAERSGIAYFHVTRTFSGKAFNHKVIETAIEMIEEAKQKELRLAQRVRALVG